MESFFLVKFTLPLAILLLVVKSYSAAESDSILHFNNTNNSTMEIMLVTYTGSRDALFRLLIPGLHRFLNPLNFTVTAVLDDESPKEHQFGSELEQLGLKVRYNEANLEALKTRPFVKYGNQSGDRYASMGYTRQSYTTWFFDQYSDSEIIGIIDSDVSITSYMLPSSLISGKQIILHGVWDGGTYLNDYVALGLNRTNANGTINRLFDLMITNYMPQFLYRSTYINARKFVMKTLGVQTFTEAWKIFAVSDMCSANVIANYG